MEGDYAMKTRDNNCDYQKAGKNPIDQDQKKNVTVQENATKKDVHAPFIGFADSPDSDTFLFGMLERVCSN